MNRRAYMVGFFLVALLASSGRASLFAQATNVRLSNEARILANLDRSAGTVFVNADTDKNGKLSKTELSKADPRVQAMVAKLAVNLNPALLPAPAELPDIARLEFLDKQQFNAHFRAIIRQRALDALEAQRQQHQFLLAQQEAVWREAQARAAAMAAWNAQAAAQRQRDRERDRDRDRDRDRERRERDRERDRERRLARQQNQPSGGVTRTVTTTPSRTETGVPRGTNPFPVVPRR